MPLIKPAIATVAVLHAIGVWNELVLATIYLTSKAYYPITRGLIVFNGIYGNDWPMLAVGGAHHRAAHGHPVPGPAALHHRRLHPGSVRG